MAQTNICELVNSNMDGEKAEKCASLCRGQGGGVTHGSLYAQPFLGNGLVTPHTDESHYFYPALYARCAWKERLITVQFPHSVVRKVYDACRRKLIFICSPLGFIFASCKCHQERDMDGRQIVRKSGPGMVTVLVQGR